MAICKKCGSSRVVKSGIVADKQRYKCKDCKCNFREGDNRTSDEVALKKALCILLYAMARGPFRMMGRILGIDHALVYRWVRAFGDALPKPGLPGNMRPMEFEELRQFIGSKKASFEGPMPLTVVQGELWPGCSAVMILQSLGGPEKR